LAQTTHSAATSSSFTAATAVSLALLLANILLINGFPDAESDARVGKRTLVVRLGPAPAAGLYLGLVLLAHGWLATSVWLLIHTAGCGVGPGLAPAVAGGRRTAVAPCQPRRRACDRPWR
jgi:1,4-dihydroxy-2-naphthoate octaprenyltransferase